MGKTIAQLGRYLDLIITKTAELGYAAKPIASSLSGDPIPNRGDRVLSSHGDRSCSTVWEGMPWVLEPTKHWLSVDLPLVPDAKRQRWHPVESTLHEYRARHTLHTRGPVTYALRDGTKSTDACGPTGG